MPLGQKAGSRGESSPYQEGRGWCLGSTSRLAFACQLLPLELSMRGVRRTCSHDNSPGFFCSESLRSPRAPPLRQPCAEARREGSHVPEAAPRCKPFPSPSMRVREPLGPREPKICRTCFFAGNLCTFLRYRLLAQSQQQVPVNCRFADKGLGLLRTISFGCGCSECRA